ncbi:MAG: glutamate racemase [Anaerovoracaceae bacterium]
MDNRPIGFFDSGLGGLTCVPHLMRKIPKERIVYFGDTARTPYGSKSPETIKQFTMQIGEFLVKQNVKMIVIACNTVSATCLDELKKMYPEIPVVGIIQPTARQIANASLSTDKIGIIATKVTIQSNAYENMIKEINPNLQLFSEACPAFVPLIEEGIIQNDIMNLTIKYYLEDFISQNKINTLVLGCTHYPLIRKNITKLYPQLKIINPSEEIIDEIDDVLRDKDLYADNPNQDNVFYASDLSENFVNMIQKILETEPDDINIKFKNLDI